MISTLIGLALKYLGDDLIQAIFGAISAEMQKRALLNQGAQQQHAADQAATITQATDDARIQENVARDSDSQLDADLERVRLAGRSNR